MKIKKTINELLEFCIINLDKPAGLTSFDCVEKIMKLFDAKKAGHFGTLDCMVTGVLPIALNRACRLSNYFMKKDKEYVGKMIIHKDIDEKKLKEEMEKFLGKIMQKPPVRSSVKRVLRERIVNKFRILNKNGKIVEFVSDVQAGTYIRKLISDLGGKIGGAHMIELRRVRAGLFKINESHSIDEIKEAFLEYKKGDDKRLREILIPAEIIKQVITSVQINEKSIIGLLNGKPLIENDIIGNIPNSDLLSAFCKDRFIGIYRVASSESISSGNSKIAVPEFVFN